jgi:hypothetical protein
VWLALSGVVSVHFALMVMLRPSLGALGLVWVIAGSRSYSVSNCVESTQLKNPIRPGSDSEGPGTGSRSIDVARVVKQMAKGEVVCP